MRLEWCVNYGLECSCGNFEVAGVELDHSFASMKYERSRAEEEARGGTFHSIVIHRVNKKVR
jgi:hypothetical protein